MRVATTNVFIAGSRDSTSVIERVLEEVPGCEVMGKSDERHETLEQVLLTRPGLVILEHGHGNLDARETIRAAKKEVPELCFLVLLADESRFWEVFPAKANGYQIWPTTWLPKAIATIANGGVWLGPRLTEYLLQGEGWNILQSASASITTMPAMLAVLSNRERDVLHLMVDGLTNKQIADSLQLSDGTVKVHVKHILNKLSINHRGQATAMLAKMRSATGF